MVGVRASALQQENWIPGLGLPVWSLYFLPMSVWFPQQKPVCQLRLPWPRGKLSV